MVPFLEVSCRSESKDMPPSPESPSRRAMVAEEPRGPAAGNHKSPRRGPDWSRHDTALARTRRARPSRDPLPPPLPSPPSGGIVSSWSLRWGPAGDRRPSNPPSDSTWLSGGPRRLVTGSEAKEKETREGVPHPKAWLLISSCGCVCRALCVVCPVACSIAATHARSSALPGVPSPPPLPAGRCSS